MEASQRFLARQATMISFAKRMTTQYVNRKVSYTGKFDYVRCAESVELPRDGDSLDHDRAWHRLFAEFTTQWESFIRSQERYGPPARQVPETNNPGVDIASGRG